MKKIGVMLLLVAVGIGIGLAVSSKIAPVQAKNAPGTGFAAVPGGLGAEDISGAYDVVKNWPQDISTLPGNEKWTYGAGESVFAESPDRIYMLFRGELPKMAPPKAQLVPQAGPSITFPVAGFWRDATTASLPGTGGTDNPMSEWLTAWEGKSTKLGIKGPPYRELGRDAEWKNCLVVVNREGKIIEVWNQWDKLFRRPHSVYISPYDPEKRVWVVDDNMQAIYIFTHDGKQLLQTIGTPGKLGADATHFHRPTFLTWLPDGTFYVADGYNGTRVAKFDKNGKFLLDWGIKGTPPDTRPGYFNVVHGLAADPMTHRIYVSDRGNRRMQVFDENGKFVDQWPFAQPSSVNFLYISANRQLWAFDDTTSKVVRYDMQGHLLYAWGALGDYPGGLFNMHGASVDQEGNLYIAEVANGRVQKFKPRAGANPEFVVGKPVYSAWK